MSPESTKYETKLSLYEEAFFVSCLLITALNDHYLKQEYGNFITGKLSDLFGPFVFYRLLLGFNKFGLSSKTSAALTVILMVSLKLNQEVSDFIATKSCQIMMIQSDRCSIIADPTDLLALGPFLFYVLKKSFGRSSLI